MMKDGFKILQFKKATVVRDGKTLLGPLSFSVQSSGITAILGHNGAGKSLLLMLCHGQFPASAGEVLWNGLSAENTRKCRSFMFQNTPLLRRSVACNIEFPLIAHGVPMYERPALVANALSKARLTDHASTPAARLSGGERQRLALARAWVTRPQVILLDEPAASLDPASTKELESMVKAIAATGVKVFIATHDLQQAQRLADDALVFGAGKLLAAEKTNTLFNMPRIGPVADFLSGKL